MMKKIMILLSFISFFNCKSLSNYINQEIKTTQNNAVPFILKGNQMVLPIKINNKRYNFIFDTGSTTSIITDKSIISKQLGNGKLVKLPDNTKIKVKEEIFNVDLKILKSKNKVFNTYPVKKRNCDVSNNSGIIGVDFFSLVSQEKIIELNFNNSTISLINKKEDIKSKFFNYQEIESDFTMLKNPSIFLSMNGVSKPIKFLLDTGFDYSIHLNSKLANKIEKDSISAFSGISGALTLKQEINKKNKISMKFYTTILKFNDLKIRTLAGTSSNIKFNIVGMEFIKKFNWIIDFKNKKIYVQKNKDYNSNFGFNKKIYNKDIIFGIINNKITIISKNIKDKKYKVGDYIISVEGMKITDKNICSNLDKLNKGKTVEFETNSP
jgi:predicted aspartyl protease